LLFFDVIMQNLSEQDYENPADKEPYRKCACIVKRCCAVQSVLDNFQERIFSERNRYNGVEYPCCNKEYSAVLPNFYVFHIYVF